MGGGFGGCTERCEVICPPKPKPPKCDPSPYCKGYNCCYPQCEIVCEFIEFRGGKKGGFGGYNGGYNGGFYYDFGGYNGGGFGGKKGGKKGGKYPNYAPPKKGGYYGITQNYYNW